MIYSQLSLSRSRMDPLNHFEISVLRQTSSAELRKLFILKNIVEKRRNCSSGAISPLIHNILLLMLDFYIKTRTRFSPRDKRLFEIIKVEITRVCCICNIFLMIIVVPFRGDSSDLILIGGLFVICNNVCY